MGAGKSLAAPTLPKVDWRHPQSVKSAKRAITTLAAMISAGGMEAYQPIKNWAPIAGRWQFPTPVDAIYESPQQENNPFGICVSNIRFSEGEAKVTVQLPEAANGSKTTTDGRILLGYRSINDPYIAVGLGGYGYAFTITQFDRIQGWRGVALAGSQQNLQPGHPYEIVVHVRGQRLALEVDDVQVLEHVLDFPIYAVKLRRRPGSGQSMTPS